MSSKHVVVITGPTACGKSKLAVNIADNFNGEIINADSLQIYKGLKVLTAVPTGNEISRVKHHLYSILQPNTERSTLGWWLDAAMSAIDDIISRGKLPIVVGGTGLYINGLLYGITPIPDIDPSILSSVEKEFVSLGAEEFWKKLIVIDPLAESVIKNSDPQRMKRAYAVKIGTGKSITEWWKIKGQIPDYNFQVFLINKDKEYLYEQCNARFFKMIESGAIQEVIEFRQTYGDIFGTINNAIGLTEIEEYLDGKISLSEVINAAQIRTRQYAKRQMTWFRNKLVPTHTISENDDNEILEKVSRLISCKLGYHQTISRAVL